MKPRNLLLSWETIISVSRSFGGGPLNFTVFHVLLREFPVVHGLEFRLSYSKLDYISVPKVVRLVITKLSGD